MDIGDKKINEKVWPYGYIEVLDTLDWELAHNSHLFGVLMPILMSTHDIDVVIEIGIDRAWVTQVAVESMMGISGGGTLYSVDIREDSCELSRKLSDGYLSIEHFVFCQDSTVMNWESVCTHDSVATPILAVVDGDHSHDGALADFRQCDKVMKEGSIFLAHDFTSTVRKAADEFLETTEHHWGRIIINDNSPVAIMQKGRRK